MINRAAIEKKIDSGRSIMCDLVGRAAIATTDNYRSIMCDLVGRAAIAKR